MSDQLVEMTGIEKHWGEVTALAGVDFSVSKGEIVGLLGDNGAGKSTLIKILSGVERPSSGIIRFKGQPVKLKNTRDAIKLGIETIFQDSALVEQLSIGRNLFLGREPVKGWGPVRLLHKHLMDEESAALMQRVGISKNLDSQTPITSLSGGERQAVAIARAMYFDSELIILDEPTNNLGLEETIGVLRFLRQIREDGRGSILITHTLNHVFEVCDRAVVLRRGRVVADLRIPETTPEELSNLIMGIPVSQSPNLTGEA